MMKSSQIIVWVRKFKFSSIFVFFVTAVLLLLNTNEQLGNPLLTNDFNAWMLPAIAPLNGLGFPYKDYWAIEPPALLLMTAIWGVFGQSLAWFHVLLISLEVLTCWMYWKIVSKVFPTLGSVILYCVGIFFYFSSAVQSMFLPSEINGSFFSLLGLLMLLSKERIEKKVFWASLFFGLAGQMKEVFAFTVLALVPDYIKASLVSWKFLLKIIWQSIKGMSLMLFFVFGYLISNAATSAYHEVILSKSGAFQITNLDFQFSHAYQAMQFPIYRFILVNYSLLVLSVGSIAIGWLGISLSKMILLKKSRKNVITASATLPKDLYSYLVLICYWIGSWIGYIAQNRYGNKYDIAVLFSTLILLAILSKIITFGIFSMFEAVFNLSSKVTKKYNAFVFAVILGCLILPNRPFLVASISQVKAFSPSGFISRWLYLEIASERVVASLIKEKTTESDCIQGVYGWGVGSLYIYSERKPCTRFFIPNIITPDQVEEYRRSIVKSPPAAIFYSIGGADLDISVFERDVFNYSSVISNCYILDTAHKGLYWPKMELLDSKGLSLCVEQNATQKL